MAELKTKLNDASVDQYLEGIKDEQTRADCYQILDMMQKVIKAEPKMWGTSIIGFGSHHLKYASGREIDWFLAGFSPRKQNITLSRMGGFEDYYALLGKLGRHTLGKGCLYIKKLGDVDTKVLTKIVTNSVRQMKQSYG